MKNKFVFLVSLCFLILTPSTLAAVPPVLIISNGTSSINTSGLVGYWRFEQSSGSAATNDSSGYGNMGTLTYMNLTGNASSGLTQGRFGNAMKFDGVDDYVTAGDVLDIRASDMAISAWFKTGSPNATNNLYIIAKSDVSGDNGRYGLGITKTGTLASFLDVGSTIFVYTDTNMADNTWHHVTVVFDRDANISIYVDGAFKNASDISAGDGSNYNLAVPFRIGSYSDDTALRPFNGTIDEVMIWNRSLTANEVRMLYNNQYTYGQTSLMLQMPNKANGNTNLNTYTYRNQSIIQNDTGLVGYWKFENESADGTLAYDSSGYGNTGTLANMSVTGNATNGWTDNGKFGKGILFSGVNNSFVRINKGSALDISSSFTVSAWAKHSGIDASTGVGFVITDRDGCASSNYRLGVNTGTTSVAFTLTNTSGSWFQIDSVTALNTNQWYLVTGVYDNSTGNMTLFINGNRENQLTVNGTPYTGSNVLRIGSEGCNGPRNFNGTIDEVRIYNRSLSSVEIAELYNQTRPAGYEYYLVNTTGNSNYTSMEFMIPLNITKASASFTLYINNSQGNQNYFYPNASNATGISSTRINNEGGWSLLRNGTPVGILVGSNLIQEIGIMPSGIWNYSLNWTTGPTNYSVTSILSGRILTILKGILTTHLYLNGTEGSLTWIYPNATNATATVTPRFNDEGEFSLLRDDVPIGSAIGENYIEEDMLFGAGTYNYSLNATGFQNYTIYDIISDRVLTILTAFPTLRLVINGTESNRWEIYPKASNITGWVLAPIDLFLEVNGTHVANGTSVVYNESVYPKGIYNFTLFSNNTNYTQQSITRILKMFGALNLTWEELWYIGVVR